MVSTPAATTMEQQPAVKQAAAATTMGQQSAIKQAIATTKMEQVMLDLLEGMDMAVTALEATMEAEMSKDRQSEHQQK